jgi:hypothetical protein
MCHVLVIISWLQHMARKVCVFKCWLSTVHGRKLPHGLTEEMKEAVDRLVSGAQQMLCLFFQYVYHVLRYNLVAACGKELAACSCGPVFLFNGAGSAERLGRELLHGLTEVMKEEVDRLVRSLRCTCLHLVMLPRFFRRCCTRVAAANPSHWGLLSASSDILEPSASGVEDMKETVDRLVSSALGFAVAHSSYIRADACIDLGNTKRSQHTSALGQHAAAEAHAAGCAEPRVVTCVLMLFCVQATEEISAFICPALVDEHGHAVLRLSMGRLLDILLANMETAAAAAAGQTDNSSSSSQAKLMMFSGHDSTIMPLLTGAWL